LKFENLRKTEEIEENERSLREVWLLPIGYLMDLWECHKQFIGISKPRKEYTIDDVVPEFL
jgi:hypothetical protein